MTRAGFEETKIAQPAIPQFLVAWPLVSGVVIAVILFSMLRPTPPWLWVFLVVEGALQIGTSIYFYKLWKEPAYVIVRHDEFVVKPALRTREDVYSFADMAYFESRLTSGSRSKYWQTFGIRRYPLGRVKLPLLDSAKVVTQGGINGDSPDIRTFKLLKAALENWQQVHGVTVEPRLADKDRGFLT